MTPARAGIHLGRWSEDDLVAIRRAAASADVTYAHLGSTLRSDPRPGIQLRRSEQQLGHGRTVFEAACDGLRRWAPHRAFGARVHPHDAPIETGTTLLVVLARGPFEAVAPNRIVKVVDEPSTFGFAYGTLPGHPESGEESFLVAIAPDGAVSASVTIDAAPATRLTRLADPAVRVVQDIAVRRYLAGIRAAASEAGPS